MNRVKACAMIAIVLVATITSSLIPLYRVDAVGQNDTSHESIMLKNKPSLKQSLLNTEPTTSNGTSEQNRNQKNQQPIQYTNQYSYRQLKQSRDPMDQATFKAMLANGLVNQQGEINQKLYTSLITQQSDAKPISFSNGIEVTQSDRQHSKLALDYHSASQKDPWGGGALTFNWTDMVDAHITLGGIANIKNGLGFKAKITLPSNLSYDDVMRGMNFNKTVLTADGKSFNLTAENFSKVPNDQHAMYFTLGGTQYQNQTWWSAFISFLMQIISRHLGLGLLSGDINNIEIGLKTEIDVNKTMANGAQDDPSKDHHLTKDKLPPSQDKQLKLKVNFYDSEHIDNNWNPTSGALDVEPANGQVETWNDYIQPWDPTVNKIVDTYQNEQYHDNYKPDTKKQTADYGKIYNYFSHQVDSGKISGSPADVNTVMHTTNRTTELSTVGLSPVELVFDQELQVDQGYQLLYDQDLNQLYYRPNQPWHFSFMAKRLQESLRDSGNFWIAYDPAISDWRTQPIDHWGGLQLNGRARGLSTSPTILEVSGETNGAIGDFFKKGAAIGKYHLGAVISSTNGNARVPSNVEQFDVIVTEDVPQMTAKQTLKNLKTSQQTTTENHDLKANPGETIRADSDFEQTNYQGGTSHFIKPHVGTKIPAGANLVKGTTKLAIYKGTGANKKFMTTLPIDDSNWYRGKLDYDFSTWAAENGDPNHEVKDAAAMVGEYTYNLQYDYFFGEDSKDQVIPYNQGTAAGYVKDQNDNSYNDGPHNFASTNIGLITLGHDVVKMAPTLTLDQANQNNTYNDTDAISLTGNWLDEDSPSVDLYYQIDKQAPVKAQTADNSVKGEQNPYQLYLDAKQIGLGEHDIHVYAQDPDGLKSEIAKTHIKIVNVAPTVSIDQAHSKDQPAEINRNDNFDFSGKWLDPDSKTVSVTYATDQDPTPVTIVNNASNIKPGTANDYGPVTVPSTKLHPGLNAITVVAHDVEGNTSAPISTYVNVAKSVPPLITLSKNQYILDHGTSNLTISGTVTDVDSATLSIYYQIGQQTPVKLVNQLNNSTPGQPNNWQGIIDTSGLTDKTTVQVYAVDDTDLNSTRLPLTIEFKALGIRTTQQVENTTTQTGPTTTSIKGNTNDVIRYTFKASFNGATKDYPIKNLKLSTKENDSQYSDTGGSLHHVAAYDIDYRINGQGAWQSIKAENSNPGKNNSIVLNVPDKLNITAGDSIELRYSESLTKPELGKVFYNDGTISATGFKVGISQNNTQIKPTENHLVSLSQTIENLKTNTTPADMATATERDLVRYTFKTEISGDSTNPLTKVILTTIENDTKKHQDTSGSLVDGSTKDVQLSTDQGKTWQSLANESITQTNNGLQIKLPDKAEFVAGHSFLVHYSKTVQTQTTDKHYFYNDGQLTATGANNSSDVIANSTRLTIKKFNPQLTITKLVNNLTRAPKFSQATAAYPGDDVSYKVTIKPNDTDDLSKIELRDLLPKELVSSSIDGQITWFNQTGESQPIKHFNQSNLNQAGDLDIDTLYGQSIVLPAGEKAALQVTISATVEDDVLANAKNPAAVYFNNTATVSNSSYGDNNGQGWSSKAATVIMMQPRLTLQKSVKLSSDSDDHYQSASQTPLTVNVGDQLDYRVKLNTDSATNAVLSRVNLKDDFDQQLGSDKALQLLGVDVQYYDAKNQLLPGNTEHYTPDQIKDNQLTLKTGISPHGSVKVVYHTQVNATAANDLVVTNIAQSSNSSYGQQIVSSNQTLVKIQSKGQMTIRYVRREPTMTSEGQSVAPNKVVTGIIGKNLSQVDPDFKHDVPLEIDDMTPVQYTTDEDLSHAQWTNYDINHQAHPDFVLSKQATITFAYVDAYLKLTVPENMDFGKRSNLTQDDHYYAAAPKTNRRVTPYRAKVEDFFTTQGWRLTVQQDSQFKSDRSGQPLTNAQLTFDKGNVSDVPGTAYSVHDPTYTADFVTHPQTNLVAGETQTHTLMQYQSNQHKPIAYGAWYYNFGKAQDYSANQAISLTIPEQAKREDAHYTANLTWRLEVVPQ